MSFASRLFGAIEGKSAAERANAGARYFVGGGQPYRTAWDVDRAVREGMERITYVFKCVDAIASAEASKPLMPRKGDPLDGEWMPNSDTFRLLNRQTNPDEVASFFRYRVSALLLLSKKGVPVEVVLNRGGRPTELHVMPLDLTNPIPDTPKMAEKENRELRRIWRWEVRRPDGKVDYLPPYDPRAPETNSVIWFRKPHPTDPYLSMTPLEAMGLAIDTMYYAKLFNRNFMQNDGRPGGIVAVKGRLGTEDGNELKSRYAGGLERAGRTSVIEADDVNFIDTAASPRDLQYTEGLTVSKDEILLGFGVPESQIGNASGRTFDNADAEELMFWRQTMKNHAGLTLPVYDLLTPGGYDDDEFMAYDLSDVAVLERDKRLREDRLATDLEAGRITLDEYRKETGRPELNLPVSRVLWVTPGRLPVGSDEDVEAVGKLAAVGSAVPADPAVEARRGAEMGVREADRIAENRRSAFRLVAGAKAAEVVALAERKTLQAKAAPKHSDGIMVCLVPDDETRAKLAIDGGLDVDDLHVTLAYLGKTGDADEATYEAVEQAVRLAAQELAPLAGEIAGLGEFRDMGEGAPLISLVDVPGLNGWREALLRNVALAGGNVHENHGYTPHLTLGYGVDENTEVEDPGGTPLSFGQVWLVWGDEWMPYDLTGGYDGTFGSMVAQAEQERAEALERNPVRQMIEQNPEGQKRLPFGRSAERKNAAAPLRWERWDFEVAEPVVTNGPMRQRLRALAQAQIDELERQYADGIEQILVEQEALVVGRLQGRKARQNTRHWTVAGGARPVATKAIDPDYVLDPARVAEDAARLGEGLALSIVTQAATDASQRLDADLVVGVESEYVRDAVSDAIEAIGGFSESIADLIRDVILAEDSTDADLDEILDAVKGTYAQRRAWAESAARLHVNALANRAALEAAQAAGSMTAQWLSSHDERVRPTHRDADGQVVATGDGFNVGAFVLQYPADMSGLPASAPEVYGCRCTMLFSTPTTFFDEPGWTTATEVQQSLPIEPDAAPLTDAQVRELAAAGAVMGPEGQVIGLPTSARTVSPAVGYRTIVAPVEDYVLGSLIRSAALTPVTFLREQAVAAQQAGDVLVVVELPVGSVVMYSEGQVQATLAAGATFEVLSVTETEIRLRLVA